VLEGILSGIPLAQFRDAFRLTPPTGIISI